MSSPVQTVVTGCRQDFSIPNAGTFGIRVTAILDWALGRYVIVPLFGTVTPNVTPIHQEDMPTALGVGGVLDTGWMYYYGASETVDSQFNDWFTSRGLVVPPHIGYGDFALPRVINLPAGATGVRIYNFAFYGSFDATPLSLTFDLVDTSGVGGTLTPVDPGHGAYAGQVYRSAWAAPYVQTVTTPSPVTLSSIVSNICKRGGLSITDFDASALNGTNVIGYPIARQANAADCLLPLLQAYFAYGSEYEAKLAFQFYGQNANVTISIADLLEGNDANDGAIKKNLRNQATEFPRRIVGKYMDPAQNYMVVTTAAERRSVDVLAIGDQSFDIPVVMAANEAAKAVDKALKVAYATLEGKIEYSVPFAGTDTYLKLAAGEPLIFNGKRWVVDEAILSTGYLKLTTRYDRQSAYTSNVQAIAGNPPTPSDSLYSGPTTLAVFNLPSLRPQDTYGVYLVAASTTQSDAWRGCTVQVSYDGQASWTTATQITLPSVIGSVALAEPTGGEPITVDVSDTLESVTAAQIAANANAFAVTHASTGKSELGQFETATSTGTPLQYELTGVTRGKLGTTNTPVAVGDVFAMLEYAYFLAIDPSFSGKTLYFRAVGFNENEADADIVTFVYEPDLTVIQDGGVVTP